MPDTAARLFRYPEPDALTLVVRAAGERTEHACIELFRRQLPDPDQLLVVRERPFSRAVVRCFEAGLDAGRPWLVAIDADILPLPDAAERAREICGKMAKNAFVATPLFLCRTAGALAMRGLHCYRASLLGEALSLADGLPADLRPESRFHDAMRARGWTREVYAKVLGVHEFEQSPRHAYLKALLRARKDPFAAAMLTRLLDEIERTPTPGADLLAAAWGLEDGLAAGEDAPAEYDWTAPLPALEARLAARGLAEPPPLDLDHAAALPLAAIASHDYRADRVTEPWIREMLAFDRGAPGVIESVRTPPRFTRPAPGTGEYRRAAAARGTLGRAG